MRAPRLRRPPRAFRLAQKAIGRFPGRPEFTAKESMPPATVVGVKRRLGIPFLCDKRSDARVRRFRFVGGKTLAPRNGRTVVGLQFQPLAGRGGRSGVAPWRSPARLVRQL